MRPVTVSRRMLVRVGRDSPASSSRSYAATFESVVLLVVLVEVEAEEGGIDPKVKRIVFGLRYCGVTKGHTAVRLANDAASHLVLDAPVTKDLD